jgi:hypothetical protein
MIDLAKAQQLCDTLTTDRTVQAVKRYALNLDVRLVDATAALELLPGLIAELRATREVIEEVRRWEIGDEWTDIMAAIAAYEKVTGEASR